MVRPRKSTCGKHRWNQREQGDERARDRLSKADQVEDTNEGRECPEDLLRATEINSGENAPDGQHRERRSPPPARLGLGETREEHPAIEVEPRPPPA